MECEGYREWIQAFVDGELSDAQTDLLREHCMRCRSCARYLREMDALQRAAASLGDEPLPAGLHERILTNLRREAQESRQAAAQQQSERVRAVRRARPRVLPIRQPCRRLFCRC